MLTTWHDHLDHSLFTSKNLKPILGVNKVSVINNFIVYVDCQVSKAHKLLFLTTHERVHTTFELMYVDL